MSPLPMHAAIATLAPATAPAEHFVSSADDIAELEAELRPGDVLVLADGEWADQHFTINADGTLKHPITIRAQTPGKAVFTGDCAITLAGDHLTLRGVRFQDFTGKDRAAIAVTGSHGRVTDCA